MRSPFARGFLSVAAAAMLGGCGNASQMDVATPARFDAAATIRMAGAQRSGQSGALLYVTNYSSTVAMYSYPRGRKVGEIPRPDVCVAGVCTDPAQNVYITDVGDGAIYEYRHGGTTPIKVLSDPYGMPVNCAVDAHTGNLAVNSDYFDIPPILIYPAATGSPTQYSVDGLCHYGSIAYDQKGNLFVGAYSGSCSQQTSQPHFHVFELLPGRKTFRLIKLKTPMMVPPVSPLALRSDGTHLLVGDYPNCRIDRYTVASDRAKFIDSIHMQGIPDLQLPFVSSATGATRYSHGNIRRAAHGSSRSGTSSSRSSLP